MAKQTNEYLIDLVRGALYALEVDGTITMEDCPRPDTVSISVDGEYFGIYDYKKLTFVD
jgi:hypothetical protein